MKIPALIMAVLASALTVSAEAAEPFRQRANITFATVDGWPLQLDLYTPANGARTPLLVWVHGGSWRGGSRDGVPNLALVGQGYAIASIDYRLSPVAKFPAQMHDIKAAIRFLRAHASEYGYDGGRIGIMGSSAGAHLAALAGVTNGSGVHEGTIGNDRGTSSAVQAIVSYYGGSNLTSILKQSTPFGLSVREPALQLLFDGTPEEKPELARLASPVFFVDAGDPPLFLLHGDQDPQMPINQSHELHGAYKAKNLKVGFEVVHGAVHGGDAFYDEKRTALVKAFLDQHLRAAP
jgi:acetyl esterase/lipase